MLSVLILLAVSLAITLAVVAFNLAVYAMPLMVGVQVFRLISGVGGGFFVSAVSAVGAAVLSVTAVLGVLRFARNPVLRLSAVAIYVVPTIVAGYALIHGIARHAVESPLGLQVFAGLGGAFIGAAAFGSLLAAMQRSS